MLQEEAPLVVSALGGLLKILLWISLLECWHRQYVYSFLQESNSKPHV